MHMSDSRMGYSDITEMVTKTNRETGFSYQEKVTRTQYYMIHIN